MRSHLIIPAVMAVLAVIVLAVIILMPSPETGQNLADGNSALTGAKATPSQETGPAQDTQEQITKTADDGSKTLTDTSKAEDSTQSGNEDKQSAEAVSQAITSNMNAIQRSTPSANDVTTAMNKGSIAGKVINFKNEPVENALVKIVDFRSAATGPDGLFSFKDIQAPFVTILVSHGEYEQLTKEKVPVGSVNLSLVLIQAGTLSGRVIDQFNDPVAYADINIQALEGVWMRNIKSDANGLFLIEDPPQARVRLSATQEGFPDEGKGALEVNSPSSEEIVLQLERPSFSISGRVIMQDTKTGVANFKLMAKHQEAKSDEAPTVTQTDGSGFYQFEKLNQGSYLVSSAADENAALGVTIPLDQDFKTVRVYEWDAKNVDFEAVPGREIGGAVSTNTGQPVSGAEVTIAQYPSVKAYSDRNGRFRLTNAPVLSQGAQTSGMGFSEIRILASHAEYGTGLSDPIPTDPNADLSNINIILGGAANLDGTVVDTSGAAVDGVHVVLQDLMQGRAQETFTDAAGTFQFSQISTSNQDLSQFRGSHIIIAEKEGYAKSQRELFIQAGEPQAVQLVLEQGTLISGRATDQNGNGLPGVQVTAQLPKGGAVTANTDEVGIYQLNGLPEGVFDLQFRLYSQPPLAGNLYRIPAGTQNADVMMTPNEWSVTGTAIDTESGGVINYYMISIEGKPLDPRSRPFVQTRVINSPDGTYQISLTEPGLYTMRFTANGYEPFEQGLEISETTLRTQFKNANMRSVQGTGTIAGVFIPPEGTTFAGINVIGLQYYPLQGNQFVLEQIPNGKHSLLFYVQENPTMAPHDIGAITVNVQANQTTNLGTMTDRRLSHTFRP